MSNPQIEDGFTRIANELLEQLARIRIPGEAQQVFSVILRQTYGFGKKTDVISLSQFVAKTGLAKPSVSRAIRKLVDIKVINKNVNDFGVSYSINKHFTEWEPLTKKLTCTKKIISVNENVNIRVPKSCTQKKVTKETLTKEIIGESTVTEKLRNYLIENEVSVKQMCEKGNIPNSGTPDALYSLELCEYMINWVGLNEKQVERTFAVDYMGASDDDSCKIYISRWLRRTAKWVAEGKKKKVELKAADSGATRPVGALDDI